MLSPETKQLVFEHVTQVVKSVDPAEMDHETFIILVYVVVDDLFPLIAHYCQRPGPDPHLSDSEVIALSLVYEWTGWSEKSFYSYIRKNYRHLFPRLNERSRFNRRRRDLALIINELRKLLLPELEVYSDRFRILDSLPVRVCRYGRAGRVKTFRDIANLGVCVAHKEKLFGFRFHFLITWRGVIHDFVLAAANHHDLTVEEEILAPYQNLQVVEDKAYIDEDRRQQLEEERHITVYTPKRRNQKGYSATENWLISHIRQLIETVGSQLVEVFHIGWVRVRSFTGLLLSIYAKITAHTLGIFLNSLWGREWLHIKEIAF